MTLYRGIRFTQPRLCGESPRFKAQREQHSPSYEERNRTAEGVALTPIPSSALNISLSYCTATGLCSVRSRSGRQSNTQCHARTHAKRIARSIESKVTQIRINILISSQRATEAIAR